MYNIVMRMQFIILLLATIAFFVIADAYPNTAPSSYVSNIKINQNNQIVVDETVNNDTFTTQTLIVGRTVGVSIQANFTGCVLCDGTVQLLGSVDGVNFVPVPDCSAEVFDNANVLFNFPSVYFPYLRVQYQERETSNTVINVWMSVKEGLG